MLCNLLCLQHHPLLKATFKHIFNLPLAVSTGRCTGKALHLKNKNQPAVKCSKRRFRPWSCWTSKVIGSFTPLLYLAGWVGRQMANYQAIQLSSIYFRQSLKTVMKSSPLELNICILIVNDLSQVLLVCVDSKQNKKGQTEFLPMAFSWLTSLLRQHLFAKMYSLHDKLSAHWKQQRHLCVHSRRIQRARTSVATCMAADSKDKVGQTIDCMVYFWFCPDLVSSREEIIPVWVHSEVKVSSGFWIQFSPCCGPHWGDNASWSLHTAHHIH